MRDVSLLSGELRLGQRLDTRFFALLKAVQASGSLRKAARTAGYSYKGAWTLLDAAAAWVHAPLLNSASGGAGGGGTSLTPVAQRLLAAWQALQARHDEFLAAQELALLLDPELSTLLRRIAMKTTARNQFAGSITEFEIGPVAAQATLTTAAGLEITATMTAAAAKKLPLREGAAGIALVKASAVVLVTDFAGYALSARNQLAGTVSRIEKGAVSSLVRVTLPGGTVITASVTNDAIGALGLAVGQPATAVFKAYAVMLAVATA